MKQKNTLVVNFPAVVKKPHFENSAAVFWKAKS